MSPDDRLDPATRARMAAKDMLRGLRHEIERLKLTRPVTHALPPRPAEALHGLFETMDRIASAGENLARDLLFTKRDESRFADFFDPRAALVRDPEAGHRFVRSRYAALKLAIAALSDAPALISESKIAASLSSLPHSVDDKPTDFEALFTLALAQSLPISFSNMEDGRRIDLNRLAALVIGLAGTVASRDSEREARDLPDLIALCIEVIKLRQSRLMPIFDGPAPDAILSPVFDELADALQDF